MTHFDADTFPGRVGANVRAFAAANRMTQQELGQLIGMNRNAVSLRWRDERQWQLEDLEAIGRALEVDPADLCRPGRWALRGSNPEPTDYASCQVGAGLRCMYCGAPVVEPGAALCLDCANADLWGLAA